MLGLKLVLLTVLLIPEAHALTSEAQEFMSITQQLEPVQCEKRRLRWQMALAEAEKRDARELRKKFSALDRDPKTARLEKRLAQLEPRVARSPDPEDLAAISRQQREAFYRCE